jgi:hypothetical protein
MVGERAEDIALQLYGKIDFENFTNAELLCLAFGGRKTYFSVNNRTLFFLEEDYTLNRYIEYCRFQETETSGTFEGSSRQMELLCGMDALQVIFPYCRNNLMPCKGNWSAVVPEFHMYRRGGVEVLLGPTGNEPTRKLLDVALQAIEALGGMLPRQYLFKMCVDPTRQILCYDADAAMFSAVGFPKYEETQYPVLEPFDEFTGSKLREHKTADVLIFDIYFMKKVYRAPIVQNIHADSIDLRHVNIVSICSVSHNSLLDLRSVWDYRTHQSEMISLIHRVFSRDGIPREIYVMNNLSYQYLTRLSTQLGFSLSCQEPTREYLRLRDEFEKECMDMMK